MMNYFLQTLVMAAGELEYSSLDFKDFPATRLMFIIVIFIVAMS